MSRHDIAALNPIIKRTRTWHMTAIDFAAAYIIALIIFATIWAMG